jgi:hypothetical protein
MNDVISRGVCKTFMFHFQSVCLDFLIKKTGSQEAIFNTSEFAENWQTPKKAEVKKYRRKAQKHSSL